MSIGMLILPWGTVLLLAIFSVVFLCGKGAFLLAGYNTLSKEEKSQYNEKKLCRIAGIAFSLMTLIVAIAVLYEFDLPSPLLWILSVSFCVVLIGMIVAANTLCKNRDAPQNYEVLTENVKKQDKLLKIAIPIVIIAFAIVLVPLVVTKGEIKFRFDEDAFYINAVAFNYDDILELEYTSDFDRGIRTNGTSNFTIKSGNYKNDEFGNYKLYSYTDCKEYIILYTDESIVVVNDLDVTKTQVLYENLQTLRLTAYREHD